MAANNKESMTVKPTVCQMCAFNCAADAYVNDEGRIVKLDGQLCKRGNYQLDLLYHKDRLMYPMIREQGELKRVSWDAALDRIADKITTVKQKYGPESVMFFAGYPKEGRPWLQRLSYLFGSPHYLTEDSFCYAAAFMAAAINYGYDYGGFHLSGRTRFEGTQCYLVWASNPSISITPSNSAEFFEAQRNTDIKVIVVDPRRTEIAEKADIHLQPRPGTDGALALAFIHVIINENLYDREFVENWTHGFDELSAYVQQFSPAKAAEITGVAADKIVAAARLYAAQKPSKLQTSACATVHTSNGIQNHRAILMLPALTGNVELPGGNCMPKPKVKTNDISLFHELTPSLKPLSGADDYPLWFKYYTEGHASPIIDQMLTGKPHPIKAVIGVGANLQIWPNLHKTEKAFQQLEFFSAIDYFHTPTTDMADVVLPAATWLERGALSSGANGRIFLRDPVVEPLGESWPDWKFVMELGKRLGFENEMWNGDLDACNNYILEPTGLTVEDLRKDYPRGVNLPVDPADEREPKCYQRRGFDTPSGKVELWSNVLEEVGQEPLPVYKEPAESKVSRPDVAAEFPLTLTTGGRHHSFTHSQFRQIDALNQLMPDPLIQINDEDAKARGIKDGDWVYVSSKRGEVRVKADVGDIVKRGIVHAFHGWPKENINYVIGDEGLDPISAYPSFKSCLCEVRLAD